MFTYENFTRSNNQWRVPHQKVYATEVVCGLFCVIESKILILGQFYQTLIRKYHLNENNWRKAIFFSFVKDWWISWNLSYFLSFTLIYYFMTFRISIPSRRCPALGPSQRYVPIRTRLYYLYQDQAQNSHDSHTKHCQRLRGGQKSGLNGRGLKRTSASPSCCQPAAFILKGLYQV